jgi:RNA polymerase sigma-70 factor (ECF subfamily)
MSRESDGSLVRRVLRGDREAYRDLVDRHQEGLYRYARAVGLDEDSAADLVQDSLVKGYQDLSRCRDPERFEMWVFRILRNRCLDHLRDVRTRSMSIDEVSLTDPTSDPVADVQRTELRDRLRATLASMVDDQREAFLLKHHHERTYEEMAELTGVSVSALKMRVKRAREVLKSALEGYEIELSK